MSHTIRWWNNPNLKKVSRRIREYILKYKVNPFYFRHEDKFIRVKQHREFRHINRIRLQKGLDVLIEPKTNGWLTH